MGQLVSLMCFLNNLSDKFEGKLKSYVSQFIKFSLVGISNTVVSYTVYALLLTFGLNYIIANVISYFAGVINSFYWNNKYVFRTDDGSERNAISSFVKLLTSSAFTGLMLNNILLYFWVGVLGISSFLGPLINLLVTYPLNYFLSKFWAFK